MTRRACACCRDFWTRPTRRGSHSYVQCTFQGGFVKQFFLAGPQIRRGGKGACPPFPFQGGGASILREKTAIRTEIHAIAQPGPVFSSV